MNKTALVTGGSEGIGKEIAKILYDMNFDLLIVARDQKKLEKAKEDIEDLSQNQKIWTFQADLSQEDAAEKIAAFTSENQIKIHTLINNAGVGIHKEIVETKTEKIKEMININIVSVANLCIYFGSIMKENGEGYILNIASLAAYQPVPKIAAYAASKAFVLNFSEAISMELKDSGVFVTCFSPGHTKTNFFKRANISDTHKFYGEHTRACPKLVAKRAVESLFDKKISSIYGIKNYITSVLNRFVTRKTTLKISNNLVKEGKK